MDIETEEKIITEYKKGKSSLIIMSIVGLSKPTILKILHKHNLVRKRDRCLKLNIKQQDNSFYIERLCPRCNQILITKSKDKTICCRNHIDKVENGTLCKPCSLELQKGDGNPFFGKRHTETSIKKISQSRKGKAKGNQNSMSNPIWKQKAIKNLKNKWNSGDLEHVRKKMSEHMKNSIKNGKIKSVNLSKKETEIFQFIKKMKLFVVQSFRVDTKICDIYLPEFNLILEYFGDYWHCNPNKYNFDYFNKKKNMTAEQIWDYDRMKVDLIKSYGYNLEIIWESDLKYNNDYIIKILNKYDTKNRFAPERSSKDKDTCCPI